MKNKLKVPIIALFLSFSVYCFLFLNAHKPTSQILSQTDIPTLLEEDAPAYDKSESYFPDLQLVERFSNVVSRVLKVL